LPKPSRKGISASKRLRQSIKRRQRNRSVKSRTRTLVGKAITLIGADVTGAEESVREAISGLDRAAQKGVIHPNAAARSKSRLLKRFNLAQANAVAVAAATGAAPAEEPGAGTSRRRRASQAQDKPASTRAPRGTSSGRTPRSRRST
jgi:small subunit ribosomal protein S20